MTPPYEESIVGSGAGTLTSRRQFDDATYENE